MDFAEFILEHEADDLGRLALSRARFSADVPDFDLALTTLEARRKLRTKVPQWYAVPGLHYPLRISAEQCSSTETARYKASVAIRTIISAKTPQNALKMGPEDNLMLKNAEKCALDGTTLADLTGGLGVDSWAFAQVFGKVLYNEMNPALAHAARHNFALLKADNITVRNVELSSPVKQGMTAVPMAGSPVPAQNEASLSAQTGNLTEVLGDFTPDIIYLDPARRAADGRKVFFLEDCQPDVVKLLPELLEACPLLLLKLSPMADITLVCKQLGNVREVHVVAAEGECKELLLLLQKGYTGAPGLIVFENGHQQILRCAQNDKDASSCHPETSAPRHPETFSPCHPETFSPCHPEERSDEGSSLYATPEDLRGYLFEPGKALLKAGAFDWPSSAFGLRKIGRHTHLFVSESPIPEPLAFFGKCFKIKDVTPLNKAGIKAMAQAYPSAEVSARNVPMSSEELRRKLGVRSGGSAHLFGVHLDIPAANYLIATLPIP